MLCLMSAACGHAEMQGSPSAFPTSGPESSEPSVKLTATAVATPSADVSPDPQSRFPQEDQWGVYIMRPDGSELRRLTTGSSWILGWLPDAEHIAVSIPRAGGDSTTLVIADSSGETEPHTILTIPGLWTSARLSPDGKWLAYVRSDKKTPANGPEEFQPVALEIASLADGSTRRLLDREFRFLDWAPDSRSLAVQIGTGDIETQQLEVITLNEPPTVTQVTTGNSPLWSPTGNRIVFGRPTAEDSRTKMSLFVVDHEGGPALRIATNFPGGFQPHLRWSPDDAFIIADGGYEEQLFRYSVFSPGLPKVLGTGIRPQLDPSGKRVACFSWEESGNRAVKVVDIDGTGQRIVQGGIGYFDGTLSWSPDSRVLVYAASEGKVASTGIYAADLATGEHRLLFDDITWEWQPVWSPDGEWIAFVREGPPRS